MTSEQPAPDVVEARKFWLSIREPGMVPRRKGPWPTKQAAEILREMMDAWPTAYIDYITLDYEGAPQIEHGPEILQMLDGRSMSKGSKHNQRVEDAEAALQARPDSALDAALAGELERVFDQFRSDLKSAHAVICKLQGLDPETHGWPEWSPPANTLRWLDKLQPKFLSALRTHDDTLEDAAMIPAEVYEFLMGTGPLEGCHFGDKPEGERGNFWWRKYLRNLKGKAKP